MSEPVIAILGLGEAGGRIAADLVAAGGRIAADLVAAGGRIAADLVAAGAAIRGFDPKVAPPAGVTGADSDAGACAGADLVLSVNSAHDALDALTQSLAACRPGTLWADLNTAAPGLKQELSRAAGDAVEVVDVAVMAPVPPTGLRTRWP